MTNKPNPPRKPAKPPRVKFEIQVVKANILKYKADVLVLKYAESWTFLSQNVVKSLPLSSPILQTPPSAGQWILAPSEGTVSADKLLLIGTPPRQKFTYDSIHDLGRTALHALAETDSDPPIRHLATTVHGLGWGFDEAEALKALVLGFYAAFEDGKYPNGLQRISIVETQAKRATVLEATLTELITGQAPTPANLTELEAESAPPPTVAAFPVPMPPPSAPTKTQPLVITPDSAELNAESTPSLSEPSIFIAMPFAKKYYDVFYLVLQPCVKDSGFQCIRLDEANYTGDIVETIKNRIRTADLVIAVLDGMNPNVFLEIGYAWGVGTPTMLVHTEEYKDEDIPFDIRAQKRISYSTLTELKERLTEELRTFIKEQKKAKGPAPKRKPPSS
jgi:hypothetical protein